MDQASSPHNQKKYARRKIKMQDGSVGRTVMVLAVSVITAGGVAAAVTSAKTDRNLGNSSAISALLPDWNIVELCQSDSASGQCRLLESEARRTLSGGWDEVSADFRSACLGAIKSPYDKSYRLLSQCIETQVLNGLNKETILTAVIGNPLISTAHAQEAKPAEGYPILPTTGTAELFAAREAWGKGPDAKPVEAPLAEGAVSPLPADAVAAPGGFDGTPTIHALEATPVPQLTPVPLDQISASLKALFAEREGWLKAPAKPAAAPAGAVAPAAPATTGAGATSNSYAVLPTTSPADVFATREAWGKAPGANSGAAATTSPASSNAAMGYAHLPTTSPADVFATREAWGKGPDPKEVPAPLATGAYSPLPSDKVELPKGFDGQSTVHAAQLTPAPQLTAVPQGQIEDAMKKLLAERQGWGTAPSKGGATTAPAPAAASSGSSSGGSGGYAILPTTNTADLFSMREAWGKGGAEKKVAAPLAAGAKSPLPASKGAPLKGFSGEPTVHSLKPTPAAQLTAVPQGQIDDAMKKLLAERAGWGMAPSKGGATAAAAQPRSAEAVDCESKLREAITAGVILFESSSARITTSSNKTLDVLASVAKGCKSGRIRVEGHTDSSGRATYNKSLSEQRAQAVANYLAKAGVAAGRIEAVGFGQENPVASNDTPAGRAKNRRIEFTVVE
jgi:OOP family OmpA-OmpF porin